MNLSTWVLDHYDMLASDQLSRDYLSKIASSMKSRLMSPEDLSRQIDDDFGLVIVASGGAKIRRYPLTNGFESLMSKAAFAMNGASLPEGARNILNDRLDAALGRYRVPVQGLVKKSSVLSTSNLYIMTREDEGRLELAGIAKEASMDKYAIMSSLDGSPLRKYPIVTDSQIRRRIDGFESLADKLHIKYAFQYADNVIARADEKGVAVPKTSKLYLYKYAGLSPNFRYYVNARMKHAPRELHEPYMGLMVKSASADPRALAVALDSIDRSCGMEMLYGKAFPNAVETSLSLEKRANRIQIDSVFIESDDLKQAIENRPDAFVSVLGDQETIERLKEDPEQVISTLPPPHRQALLDILGGA